MPDSASTAMQQTTSPVARRAWPIVLVIAAIGIYCSRSVLDVVDGPGHVVRIAMLPPVWQLVALIAAAVGAGLVAARTNADPDVAVPLAALGLLAIPYLPWLADRTPNLRALAGPARVCLWVVAGWP